MHAAGKTTHVSPKPTLVDTHSVLLPQRVRPLRADALSLPDIHSYKAARATARMACIASALLCHGRRLSLVYMLYVLFVTSTHHLPALPAFNDFAPQPSAATSRTLNMYAAHQPCYDGGLGAASSHSQGTQAAHPAALQRLPVKEYVPRQAAKCLRKVWMFSTKGQEGFSLLDACEGRLEGLDGRDDEVYPSKLEKVRYYLAVSIPIRQATSNILTSCSGYRPRS